MQTAIARTAQAVTRWFRTLVPALRDRRGVSAIEFALIAPIMIFTYIGVVELGNLITINRRVALVASTVADLAAQTKQVSASDIEDIFAASNKIMWPYDSKPLKITLSSVVADEDNKTRVAWSCANDGSGRSKNSVFSVPPGLTQPDSSVIVAEITYGFKPMLGIDKVLNMDFKIDPFTLKRKIYNRPRRTLKVELTDSKCP
jgi:Flp pilus assembly protein TadG